MRAEAIARGLCAADAGRSGTLLRLAALNAFVFFFFGCVRVSGDTVVIGNGEQAEMYVVSQGLHAGVALDTAQLPGEQRSWMPSGMRYVEVGFGDRRFYMNPNPGPLSGLRALVFRNAAVIHVAAFNEPPEKFFSGGEVRKLNVKRSRLADVMRFVDRSLERTNSGDHQRLGDGLYGISSFYAATPTFSLLYNCNDWILDLLHAAGCETRNLWVSTRGGLMRALNGVQSCS